MTTHPVVDVLLVVAEFISLFAVTWIAWFAVITAWQILSRKTSGRQRAAVGEKDMR